jgi:hypothetical protein
MQMLMSDLAQSRKKATDVALASAKDQSTALHFLQLQLNKVRILTNCIYAMLA